ncbi:MAG: YqjF family protein [Miltoncostaeaceae bacterium]
MASAPPEPITPEPPPLPGRAVVEQSWVDLAFLHWPYRPAEVQRLLPTGLAVDVHEGAAWVSLVPFEMHRLRPVGVPPVPGLDRFVEINVRTYVVDTDGHRAVWFFSLDVPEPAMVALARLSFGARYCLSRAVHATIDIGGKRRHGYAMRRIWPGPAGARASIEIEVGAPIPSADIDPLTLFLTARWAAITRWSGVLLRSPVDHGPWPVHDATCIRLEQDVVQAAGLPRPRGEPLVHFSPIVDARFARPARVAAGAPRTRPARG